MPPDFTPTPPPPPELPGLWQPPATEPPAVPMARPPEFHPVSITKLAVMSIFTLGLYNVFWFYRNWRRVKERTGSGLSPFWRAFFTPVWSYSLFDEVRDRAAMHNVPAGWSPLVLGLLYFVISVLWRLPEPMWIFCLFNFVPLIPVQSTINQMALERGVPPDDSYGTHHVAAIVVGSIVLVLALLGTFIPAPPPV